MKTIKEEQKILNQIMNMLEQQFGTSCEVVLHDLTDDYNHSIVDIRNGSITNRKIGGCGSNLGLEVLNGSAVDGDRFNYITTTADGKVLRSSSIYLKNDKGDVIGSLCINLDITETMRFGGFLRQYNQFQSEQGEFFAQDVNSLLDFLVLQAQSFVGKEPNKMNKEDRVAFLEFLYKKGAFQISKSNVRVCELLGISKFTLYNDLEAIRAKK